MEKRIKITGKDGFEMDAYRAEPEGRPKGGVIICQEIFGVNSYIEGICDFYAKVGYTAIAPALFDRAERGVNLDYALESRDRGMKIAGKVDWDNALDDLEVARDILRSAGAKKVGVVGYCWGGSAAWLFACRRQVDGAVAYYPSETSHFPNDHARHPAIMHIGEEDMVIPRETLDQIKKDQAGTPIFSYPGAPHGFDNQERQNYRADAAQLARERTLEFLARHVGN